MMTRPTAWGTSRTATAGLALEKGKVGLAVPSEPRPRSITLRGAIGTPRPTTVGCRSSCSPAGNVRLNCCGRFSHALIGLLSFLVIALGPIARSHAQGTIAFNNLANNDSSMYAKSGGLVYFYDPPNAPWPLGWGLLKKDLNFSLYAGPTGDFYGRPPLHAWLISDGSASGIVVGGGRFADPSGGVYTILGVAPGSAAFIRIEAWTGDYDRWELAVVTGESIGSLAFRNPTGGGGSPAASLVGMPSFNIGVMALSQVVFDKVHWLSDDCAPYCGVTNVCGKVIRRKPTPNSRRAKSHRRLNGRAVT